MAAPLPVQFRSWWEPLEPAAECGDCHEAARRILDAANGLPAEIRAEFLHWAVAELAGERRAFGIALMLLARLDDPAVLGRLVGVLQPLPPRQSSDEEAHLADLMRLLAASHVDEWFPPVRAYLLERPIGPGWDSVPWAVWPGRLEVFVQAWTRYFREVDPRRWKDGDVVRAFLAEPAAIAALRQHFHPVDYRRWHVLRRSLARQLEAARWLTGEDRARVRALVTK